MINKGVRQGDTISPKLFTSCLENIFHPIHWEDIGLNIEGEKLTHLKFADDIVLIANNWNEAEQMLKDLTEGKPKSWTKDKSLKNQMYE